MDDQDFCTRTFEQYVCSICPQHRKTIAQKLTRPMDSDSEDRMPSQSNLYSSSAVRDSIVINGHSRSVVNWLSTRTFSTSVTVQSATQTTTIIYFKQWTNSNEHTHTVSSNLPRQSQRQQTVTQVLFTAKINAFYTRKPEKARQGSQITAVCITSHSLLTILTCSVFIRSRLRISSRSRRAFSRSWRSCFQHFSWATISSRSSWLLACSRHTLNLAFDDHRMIECK